MLQYDSLYLKMYITVILETAILNIVFLEIVLGLSRGEYKVANCNHPLIFCCHFWQ